MSTYGIDMERGQLDDKMSPCLVFRWNRWWSCKTDHTTLFHLQKNIIYDLNRMNSIIIQKRMVDSIPAFEFSAKSSFLRAYEWNLMYTKGI